jgi:DNA-binding Xre family transcriptional regulator
MMLHHLIQDRSYDAEIGGRRAFTAAMRCRGVAPKMARRLWDGRNPGAILTVLRICRGLEITGAEFWELGLPASIRRKLFDRGETTDQAAPKIGISGRSLRDYAAGTSGETACRTLRALLAVLVIPLGDLLVAADLRRADP